MTIKLPAKNLSLQNLQKKANHLLKLISVETFEMFVHLISITGLTT